MIYTERKYLSILMLTEDRDYVTCDELIHVLKERPSNAVYIERDGILCGLITYGRIIRSRDKLNCRVAFNKKFTFVRPEENWCIQQIFRDKKNINVLPVVSEDGRLLGDYVRWNDFIGREYADLLLKDPYVLQLLKKRIQNLVFVKPVSEERTEEKEIFLWWRQRFEREGIHLQEIYHREINDYLTVDKTFLFVEENEKRGSEVLHRYLYCSKEITNESFFSINSYLHHMKRLALGCLNASVLNELENQGVVILAFGDSENNNQFLAVLNERIKKQKEKYGIDSLSLPEELKESFLDELYYGAYKTQKFPFHMSLHTRLGIPYLSDMETEFVHIQNGERLTVNQPEKYDRCIYFYGSCCVAGIYVSDQYTIPSLLQNEINEAGFFCKVVNRGVPYVNVDVDQLQSVSFKRGDILILYSGGRPWGNIPTLNLIDALEKHDAPAYWFLDRPMHCNHKANQVYAHEIYKELVPVLQKHPKGRNPVKVDFDYIGYFYLNHYFCNFDCISYGTVGSIVMNCNPFTLGHRFLIEEALKTVDFLIIFVVEEDLSLFPFEERFAMVCQGTSDLERIIVVPSGPYILSKRTFPEYFEKIDDEDLKKNTEDDITLFAEKIAPKLGITYRFVGEEPEDNVTNEYNEAMKKILPRYGIQVVEIPRKANSQSVISASRVRQCLSMNNLNELDELVPASTKRILFFENK